jgi:hypothetical protein
MHRNDDTLRRFWFHTKRLDRQSGLGVDQSQAGWWNLPLSRRNQGKLIWVKVICAG